ncbi:MAG: hypothetical protein JWP74_2315 [Marmoricola sp.]|nr:hypothetical protein [Marmoricola sp.]
MLSRSRLIIVTLVGALIAVGLSASSAQASGVPKVSGLASNGQYFAGSTLKLKWKKVSGATYQVRWASSTSKLKSAKKYAVTGTSATSPVENRCTTTYGQVRAKKSGKYGPWSTAKSLKFKIGKPGVPTMNSVGKPNAVELTWPAVTNAASYTIHWYAAPSSLSPIKSQTVSATTTSATLNLPTPAEYGPGDQQMGTAYANPVYARIQANRACSTTSVQSAGPKPFFPAAGNPGTTGDPLAVGSYNVEHFPGTTNDPDPTKRQARVAALAKNIDTADASGLGLQVVTLQEANNGTGTALASALNSLTNSDWTSYGSGSGQIIWRTGVYQDVAHGIFATPPAGIPATTPWVRLHRVDAGATANSQDIFVVSVHIDSTTGTIAQQKSDNGAAGSYLMDQITAVDTAPVAPVVAAGDYRYLREDTTQSNRFAEEPGHIESPVRFVRAGYYDAMAAVQKVGTQYATSGTHKVQTPNVAYGVGVRSDHLMLLGFTGVAKYENVANRTFPAMVTAGWPDPYPSDHNLIYAVTTVPYSE